MSHNPYGGEWAGDAEAGTQAPQTQRWAEGNYQGDFISATLISSQLKGTPGFDVRFNVGGIEKQVNIWITDATAEYAMRDLEALGWNGDMAKPEFAVAGPIELYMKHGAYKGKPKEEWRISSFEAKAPPPPSDPVLTRFAARFKSKAAAPPPPASSALRRPVPPPPARPTAPVPAAPAPAPSPKPPANRVKPLPPPPQPKPKKPSKYTATTKEEAWAAWNEEGMDDAQMFYDTIEKITGSNDMSAVTAAQWQQIADEADGDIPFDPAQPPGQPA